MSQIIRILENSSQRLRGVGFIWSKINGQKTFLPLEKIVIEANVAGRVTSITMTQVFQNVYSHNLDAVYVFPVPKEALISNVEIKLGEQEVFTTVQKKEIAEKQSQDALAQNKPADWLGWDGFRALISNIAPEQRVFVKVVYTEYLPFLENNSLELRLPLIYVPGQSLGDNIINKAPVRAWDSWSKPLEIIIPNLTENFDSKTSLEISVTLFKDEEKLDNIDNLYCSQHAICTSLGDEGVKISLANDGQFLEGDFVLRWTLSSKDFHSSLFFYQDNKGINYGMLSLVPPFVNQEGYKHKDVVLLLDTSKSMRGVKILYSFQACRLLLNALDTNDRFALLTFNQEMCWFGGDHQLRDALFTPADYCALENVERLFKETFPEDSKNINTALYYSLIAFWQRKNTANRQPIVILITDDIGEYSSGFLKQIQKEKNIPNFGDVNLFTVKIDVSSPAELQEGLNNCLGGINALNLKVDNGLVNVVKELELPLITNLNLEYINTKSKTCLIAPDRPFLLFGEHMTTIFFATKEIGEFSVKGTKINGESFEMIAKGKTLSLPAIAQLWAKNRMDEFNRHYNVSAGYEEQQTPWKEAITELSIEYKVLTRFTSYVAHTVGETLSKYSFVLLGEITEEGMPRFPMHHFNHNVVIPRKKSNNKPKSVGRYLQNPEQPTDVCNLDEKANAVRSQMDNLPSLIELSQN